MYTLLFLFSCTKDGPSGDDTSLIDTQPPFHPNAPDQLTWDRWELMLDCTGEDGNTPVFVVGTGQSDANGSFTATETWNWFYGGAWADDDQDVLTYTGDAMTLAAVQAYVGPADEGFDLIRRQESNESGTNYGSAEEMHFYFDYLSPSGGLNLDNKMIMYRGRDGRRGWSVSEYSSKDRSYYEADGEIGGPATWIWEKFECY